MYSTIRNLANRHSASTPLPNLQLPALYVTLLRLALPSSSGWRKGDDRFEVVGLRYPTFFAGELCDMHMLTLHRAKL